MRSVRQRLERGSGRALAVCAGLVGLTLLLLAATPDQAPAGPPAPWWSFVLVSTAFALAERFIFNVEYRKHSMSFSLSEIPTALAILLFDPLAAVFGRLVGGGVVLASRVKRTGSLKAVFNFSLFGFEVSLAAFVFAVLRAQWGDVSAAGLAIGLGAAVFVASVLGAACVSLVIAQFEGGFSVRLRSEIRQGLGVWLLGSLLAITVTTALLASPWLVLAPLIPVLMAWRMLMAQGQLRQQHADLVAQHDFAREVGQSLSLAGLVASARAETQRLLRAQDASLVVFQPLGDGPVIDSSVEAGWWPVSSDDPAWQDVFRGQERVVRLRMSGRAAEPALAPEWSDALAAPIADSEGIIGLLVVAERTGLLKRFSKDEMTRMRQLADQLAVSLRKSLLHLQLEHDASHDRLTGLPNRMLFETRVQEALADDGPVAVFLLDLDRFKEVNDGLGHHVGDVLLQKFADRMLSVLPPDTVVSRLAGDEFAILATGLPRATAVELGARILRAARDPFDLGELSVAVSCSIGLVLGPEQGADASTLLRRADLAMYEAKGRSGGVSVYRPDLETTNSQRLRLLQDLRVATVDEQMQAWFQPKIHLGERAVVGVEALVRWDHPDQGVLDAERFIGLAEQTDLIHTITDRMLTSALSAARSWRRRGWALGVAVNVSARSLLDELLADRIARHLHHHDVPAGMLTVEITETSVMADVSRALVTLERLDELGVQISVDDYGTGYSSLNYLRKLPVRELKIDRGFIANVLTDDHDEVIVRSTIELGRHLGLRVVAEGIENAAVAARLRHLGCELGQGVGLAPPMSLPELDRWLAGGPYGVPGRDRGDGALATA
ncbi:MAG: putative bifunctional diguanylate cyclase/phosphodiesterase [Kineosporiaceae bacterium]